MAGSSSITTTHAAGMVVPHRFASLPTHAIRSWLRVPRCNRIVTRKAWLGLVKGLSCRKRAFSKPFIRQAAHQGGVAGRAFLTETATQGNRVGPIYQAQMVARPNLAVFA